MNVVQLRFVSKNGVPQLLTTSFNSNLLGEELVCERGKLPSGRRGRGSFQWTAGVMGLVAVLIRARLGASHPVAAHDWLAVAGVSSDHSAAVVALDSAIAKHRNWLLDMFGHDGSGLAIHRRLFIRDNPEGKRPGPVRIAINSSFIDPRHIEVLLNDRALSHAEDLSQLLHDLGFDDSVSRSNATERAFSRRSDQGNAKHTSGSAVGIGDDISEVVAAAIINMERYLKGLDKCGQSQLPLEVARIEQELPSIVAEFAAQLLGRFHPNAIGRGAIRVKRSSRDSRVLIVRLPSQEGTRRVLAECPIDQPSRWRGVQVVGSPKMIKVAARLARDVAVYWRQIYGHLHDRLATRVRSFNSAAVDHLYGVLRRYASAHGVSNAALSEFSLFVHVNGRARYVLDDLRYRRIQDVLISGADPDWLLEKSEIDRHLETEAWYATSVLRSVDTMSYTESIRPMLLWTGTPDTWQRPIPGFGASEIAVYGNGTSCAEPLAGAGYGTAVSLCAVFTGEYASAFGGKFLSMPLALQRVCSSLAPDIMSLPFGGDRGVSAAT